MQWFYLIILLCLIGGLAACQRTPTCETGYIINSSAKSGCRLPSEPGCAMCCVRSANNCEVRSGSLDASGSDYSVLMLKASCPTSCAPCATCSIQAEKDLCQLLAVSPPVGCDCTNPQKGNDVCSEPESCQCYCLRYNGLVSACPAQ